MTPRQTDGGKAWGIVGFGCNYSRSVCEESASLGGGGKLEHLHVVYILYTKRLESNKTRGDGSGVKK